LRRQRRAVAQLLAVAYGRPAFHRITNVDVFAREFDRGEHFIEQLARAPDEWPPEQIFGFPRAFADDHEPRARVAFAVHVVAAFRSDLAAAAGGRGRRGTLEHPFAARAFLQTHPSFTASPRAMTS